MPFVKGVRLDPPRQLVGGDLYLLAIKPVTFARRGSKGRALP